MASRLSHSVQTAPARTQALAVALTAAMALFLAGCDIRHTSGISELSVPPGTGEVSIEMNGTWRMVDVEYTNTLHGDTPADDSIAELRHGRGLIPPAEGALMWIEGDVITVGNGQSLLLKDITSHKGEETYVNELDGKVARLEYLLRDKEDSDTIFALFQISLGAVDGDTMRGYMLFGGFALSDGSKPPEGLYGFTLERDQRP